MSSKQNSFLYTLIMVGVVSGFGPFITDFYLTALPDLAIYFKTNASYVQLSLTFGMVGLAFGQLIFGPLSDKYGRKLPLVVSISIFILATVGCIFSPTIEIFLFFRLLQGLSGAGGVVISKAIATDLYHGRELARFFSVLASIHGLAPILAPVIGGLLLQFTDWKGVFAGLLVLGILLLILLSPFRESNPLDKRLKGNLWLTFKSYRKPLCNPRFMSYVYLQGFAMGVMFTYISSSPFIFQQNYGISSLVYSLCFGTNALAIMAGSFGVLRFKKTSSGLSFGCQAFFIMSLATAALLIYGAPIILIESSLIVLMFCLGMILPTSTTLALEIERENSGNASAILGFFAFISGGICSPLTGIGNIMYTSAILMIINGSMTLVCSQLLTRLNNINHSPLPCNR